MTTVKRSDHLKPMMTNNSTKKPGREGDGAFQKELENTVNKLQNINHQIDVAGSSKNAEKNAKALNHDVQNTRRMLQSLQKTFEEITVERKNTPLNPANTVNPYKKK